ncbi:MAG TPA: GH25 family lysozyme [Bacteroidaceae bacterium]|nr:GH25 family lysozyme [Bacteroidaceae bacterium]
MSALVGSGNKKKGVSKRPKTGKKTFYSSAKGTTGSKKSNKRKSASRAKSGNRHKDVSTLLHCTGVFLFLLIVGFGTYYFLFRPYFYRWKPCYGSTEYDICIPHGYSLYGIDVSHHQDNIDWSTVSMFRESDYPLGFVFIKATEGGNHKDTRYENNIEAARSQGFTCGSYHFYNPGTSPNRQAEFFIKNVTVQKGDLPPVVDIEKKGANKAALQRELLVWLDIVEEYYGIQPIIYTNYKFKKRYLDNPQFDRYHFWIAHYYVDNIDKDCDWIFWQFSDRGRIDGIKEHTDINVFRGSILEFNELTSARTVKKR